MDLLSRVHNLRFLVPDRLAFLAAGSGQVDELRQMFPADKVSFITSDLHKQYVPFAKDFGPVNLAVVFRFCKALAPRMEKEDEKVWVYCFDNCFQDIANASFLLGAFMILYFNQTPEQAAWPFRCDAPFSIRDFRDITLSRSSLTLSLEDALAGLSKASKLGWFNWRTFDSNLYRELDNPSGGDLNEICPKFVAFKGPLDANCPYRQPNEIALTPEQCIPILQRLHVECVVRLNETDSYDPAVLLQAGITHHDLSFPDCTCPPDSVVQSFLHLCDQYQGRIAVHCRAGLGRTGTLIALWMMRGHGFTAGEAVGWLRVVRPGSVIGSQQAFLASRSQSHRPCRAPLRAAPCTLADAFRDQDAFAQLTCGGGDVYDSASHAEFLDADPSGGEEAVIPAFVLDRGAGVSARACVAESAEEVAAEILRGMCARSQARMLGEGLNLKGRPADPCPRVLRRACCTSC